MPGKFERVNDLPFQKVLEEVLIVSPRDRRVHRLNEVASVIWLQLDGPRTVRDLADAVMKEFDVDKKTATRDVETFVTELKKKGLVEKK